MKYKIQQFFIKVEWRTRGEHPYTGVFKVSQVEIVFTHTGFLVNFSFSQFYPVSNFTTSL